MSKVRTLLTASLVLAFAAGSLNAGEALPRMNSEPVAAAVGDAGTAYRCCWIYHAGNWYCLPC